MATGLGTSPKQPDRQENLKATGWAKRIGEMNVEAYMKENKWNKCSIVRPANVYGPYDNFDEANAMVIPSLIKKALSAKESFEVWGDGSAIRDFIHSRDVARGMMMVVEKGINEPVNLGSGFGTSIKDIVRVILDNLPGDRNVSASWDISKPTGDTIRIMDTKRAVSYGFSPEISIEAGIQSVLEWFFKEFKGAHEAYNAFHEFSYFFFIFYFY